MRRGWLFGIALLGKPVFQVEVTPQPDPAVQPDEPYTSARAEDEILDVTDEGGLWVNQLGYRSRAS